MHSPLRDTRGTVFTGASLAVHSLLPYGATQITTQRRELGRRMPDESHLTSHVCYAGIYYSPFVPSHSRKKMKSLHHAPSPFRQITSCRDSGPCAPTTTPKRELGTAPVLYEKDVFTGCELAFEHGHTIEMIRGADMPDLLCRWV